MHIVLYFLRPLLLTILFELLVAKFMSIRKKQDLILIIIANIMTNLPANYLHMVLFKFMGENGTLLVYVAGELLIIVTEYLLYRKHLSAEAKALPLAVSANIISFTGGLLCKRFW